MEAYPQDYIVHNLPLVVLSGLEPDKTETPFGEYSQEFLRDGGFRIRADLSPLHHPLKDDLRAALLAFDKSDAPWRSQSVDKTEQAHSFKIRSVGRAYTFPPRKAPPPPHSPRLRPANDNGISPPPLTLHSTLSPLSPNSPLYPDGIITPLWITKHQHRLPSVLISFYNLVADSGISSLEDNKIKTEVNNIRSLVSSTNYKTKFVIVLVADGPINHTELEERLVNIRRGTNFDSKALYYLPSSSSTDDLSEFAKVLFSTIHPTCIEYYRDLSKHARRKRNRNVVPQPTVPPTQGNSAVLPLQGWNVRFEFKLGIFAETRQELEAACRNYEQAYEGLFHPELFGEAIPAWSPRFNDARMLADIISIRIIRCFLWSSQTTNAVRWWTKHKDRMRELIDRRGKGTETYGWEAWQSTWSKVMAELVERSEAFSIAQSLLPPGTDLPVQILPSRSTAGLERQTPWEYLHHEGYWLNSVRKHIEARRWYASEIPAEDRERPNEGANSKSKRAHLYDTYLVPEPAIECQMLGKQGETYAKRVRNMIKEASGVFTVRGQLRMVEMLRYYESLENSNSDLSLDVISSLKPMWHQSSWRNHGWWLLLSQAGEALLRSATKLNDHELCLRLAFELAALKSSTRGLHIPEPGPISTGIDLSFAVPPVFTSFAWAVGNGHVGEQVTAQLVLQCSTVELPAYLEVVEIKISFDGGVNPILLARKEDEESLQSPASTTIRYIDLTEIDPASDKRVKRLSLAGTTYWLGTTALKLTTKHRRVFNFQVVPRQAGPVSVASIVVLLGDGSRGLSLSATDLSSDESRWWEMKNGSPTSREFGMDRQVTTMTVLPRPPRVNIESPNMASTFYTNESARLDVKVYNGEEEAISGNLRARLIGPSIGNIELQWSLEDTSGTIANNEHREVTLPPKSLDNLDQGTTQTYTIYLSGLDEPVDYELELTVDYSLSSNPENTLTTQLMVDLPVIRPFEVNASFNPRWHPGPWPDFFAAAEHALSDRPQGLRQQYLVKADVLCFAQEPLIVKALQLKAIHIVGGATCTASAGYTKVLDRDDRITLPQNGVELHLEQTQDFYFDLEIQKLALGDRSPVATDFSIEITWSRRNSAEFNTSTLELPKFLAPMAEPRVLLQARNIKGKSGMYLLTYTIENPSMHFLTFTITMEGGEGLAFSGPKMKTVSLVPVSRYDINYRVYVQKNKEWVSVRLEVLDAFFGQTLKIQPASDSVRADKQGNVQIWSEG